MLDIKAVLFDCDGLMFETELISQQIWKDEAMKLGLTLPEDFFMLCAIAIVGLVFLSGIAMLFLYYKKLKKH